MTARLCRAVSGRRRGRCAGSTSFAAWTVGPDAQATEPDRDSGAAGAAGVRSGGLARGGAACVRGPPPGGGCGAVGVVAVDVGAGGLRGRGPVGLAGSPADRRPLHRGSPDEAAGVRVGASVVRPAAECRGGGLMPTRRGPGGRWPTAAPQRKPLSGLPSLDGPALAAWHALTNSPLAVGGMVGHFFR